MTLSDAREEARNDAAREAEFKRDCREAAAQMNNDLQEIMCLVEAKMQAWGRNGWLDLTIKGQEFSNGQWRRVAVGKHKPEHYAALIASCVKEAIEDEYSAIAREAHEVAHDR